VARRARHGSPKVFYKFFCAVFINHLKDLQFAYHKGLLMFLSFGFVT
jgi:hypothetical protein